MSTEHLAREGQMLTAGVAASIWPMLYPWLTLSTEGLCSVVGDRLKSLKLKEHFKEYLLDILPLTAYLTFISTKKK